MILYKNLFENGRDFKLNKVYKKSSLKGKELLKPFKGNLFQSWTEEANLIDPEIMRNCDWAYSSDWDYSNNLRWEAK